jgi:hypothetical protein
MSTSAIDKTHAISKRPKKKNRRKNKKKKHGSKPE